MNWLSELDTEMKECSKCKKLLPLNMFSNNKSRKGTLYKRGNCKSCGALSQVDKTKSRKQKLANYKGGACVICGYDSCLRALEFHHITKEEKTFTVADMIGGRRGLSYNEEEAKKEVDKTVLLCTRCHAEVHDDMHKEKEEEWVNNYGEFNLQ